MIPRISNASSQNISTAETYFIRHNLIVCRQSQININSTRNPSLDGVTLRCVSINQHYRDYYVSYALGLYMCSVRTASGEVTGMFGGYN